MSIRVVLADDHTLVRQGIRRYLEDTGEISVVAEAGTGGEVIAEVERHEPDVALLDIRMPEMDGLEAAREISGRFPHVGVVMLTAFDDKRFVVDAVRAGARGFVLKARDGAELAQTIRVVAGGNLVIDPELVGALADELSDARERDPRTQILTGRELEILEQLAFGYTNKEIGARLYISADTVKTHLEHIYQKLGTNDRTAAVAEAMRRRLID